MNKKEMCEFYDNKLYYNMGVDDMKTKQKRQLEYIRKTIRDLITLESNLAMPLMDLHNTIGLMLDDSWEE